MRIKICYLDGKGDPTKLIRAFEGYNCQKVALEKDSNLEPIVSLYPDAARKGHREHFWDCIEKRIKYYVENEIPTQTITYVVKDSSTTDDYGKLHPSYGMRNPQEAPEYSK